MNNVLELLKKKGNKGISFKDFPTGFRLAARILDLRQTGWDIITQREPMKNGWYARYTLMGRHQR